MQASTGEGIHTNVYVVVCMTSTMGSASKWQACCHRYDLHPDVQLACFFVKGPAILRQCVIALDDRHLPEPGELLS